MYMVELHEAEKPIFAIIDYIICKSAPKTWVDTSEGSFTCQVNRLEWESNSDCLCL